MSEVAVDNSRRNIRFTVIVLVVLMLLMVATVVHKLLSPRVITDEELRINGLYVLDMPRQLKSFNLKTHKDKPFSQSDLKGKWSLVFFGFTHCPDICPTTLALLNKLTTGLSGDIFDQTQVVLVTADPARDTVAKMAEYVPFFNSEFIGLTGEFITIKRLANQLNVPFVKVTQGDDYTIDHGGQVVLINPKGDYHGFFSTPLDLAKMKLTYQSLVVTSDLSIPL